MNNCLLEKLSVPNFPAIYLYYTVHCSTFRDSRYWYVFFVLDCSALCRIFCVCVCVCVCVHVRTIVYKHVINCTTHGCRGKLYSSGVLQGQGIRRSSVNSIGQSTDYICQAAQISCVRIFAMSRGKITKMHCIYMNLRKGFISNSYLVCTHVHTIQQHRHLLTI